MDSGAIVGADYRAVEDREFEGKPAKVVVAARTYDTDVDDLWDAVTNPERLPRSFLPVEGDLKLGGHYQLKGNAGGTITRCEPPNAFDITWEMHGGVSWLNVRIAADGEGARLTLEHIAHTDGIGADFWKQYGPGAVGLGWDLALFGLGRHIELGGVRPPEGDPAWAATDEAKTFMRASAAAWGDAHIASGEDPAVARESAENTAKAYTGG